MIWDLKMIASSLVLLSVVIIQGVHGTIFPPVSDPRPIPSPRVRGFAPQTFNGPEDLPRDLPQPREEFPPPDRKPDEERWFYEENHSGETADVGSSSEIFDRYYQSGEPAIGPVATPIPDTYIPPPSGISRINPTSITNADNSRMYILATYGEGRYSPDSWIEEQMLEKPLDNPGVSTDTVKSIAVPAPFDFPAQTQFSSNPAVNIVQVRSPFPFGFRRIYRNSPSIIENVPTVKQIVGAPPLPPPNSKTIVQQKIISDIPSVALTPPATAQISSKKAFAVPPPPPPPLKGGDVPPRVISSVPVNIIPDSNVVISDKNVIPDSSIIPGKNVVQQVRHVWIPTSSKTGKFITIPISGAVKSQIPNVNKGFSLESTPVTVSDTWVLKQDGPVPSFLQQKSSIPPVPSPVVQSGKVIFQNPTIVQVEEPANPVVTRIESPKIAPFVEKPVVVSKTPRNIWPSRKEITNTKILNSYSPLVTQDIPASAVKSDTFVISKPAAEPLPPPQKSIITDKGSALPPPIPPSNLQIVNGKPCPFPLPAPLKSPFSPINSGVIPLPRLVSSQRQLPFARIIRVNRYPTGSYYLLNRNIRPNYFMYPSQAVIRQPKTGLISIIQGKQLPTFLERKIPLPPVQTKQFSIPVQSKQIVSPLPAKQVTYPFASRQIILPVPSPKSTRTIFPAVQAIRYAYPWNAYSSPDFDKGTYIPQFSPLKVGTAGSESESSSSESSSSEESSESSKDKKEEKPKKEKAKKEEKSKSEENSSASKSEKETESESDSNSKSSEKESEEKSSEKESEESLETSESQVSFKFQVRNEEPGLVTGENAHVNFVSSHDTLAGETFFDESTSK